MKISFSDSGTKADILTNLDATRAWVLDQNEENLATGRAYLEGHGAFPQRAALNQLGGRFLTEFYVTVARVGRVGVGHREGLARRRARRHPSTRSLPQKVSSSQRASQPSSSKATGIRRTCNAAAEPATIRRDIDARPAEEQTPDSRPNRRYRTPRQNAAQNRDRAPRTERHV